MLFHPSKANGVAAAQAAAVMAALPALRAAVGAGGCGARMDVRADRDGGRCDLSRSGGVCGVRHQTSV